MTRRATSDGSPTSAAHRERSVGILSSSACHGSNDTEDRNKKPYEQGAAEAVFSAVKMQEVRGVEEIRGFATVPLNRLTQLDHEILRIQRRLHVAADVENIATGIPKTVQYVRREGHTVSSSGKCWLLASSLVSGTSGEHGEPLLLEVMHVHRHPGAGLQNVLSFEPDSVFVLSGTKQSEAFCRAETEAVGILLGHG
jgi:hypothetical protein